MKSWLVQNKIIVAIIIISILLLIAYQMKWLGNTKTLLQSGSRISSAGDFPSPPANPSPTPGSTINRRVAHDEITQKRFDALRSLGITDQPLVTGRQKASCNGCYEALDCARRGRGCSQDAFNYWWKICQKNSPC